MRWTDTLDLWLTARTDDARNQASATYTCRAMANWTYAVNEPFPAMPTPPAYLTNSSNTAPGSWTLITDGRTPTLTSGTTLFQTPIVFQ